MQRYNAIWWQTRPNVNFLLPQVLGCRCPLGEVVRTVTNVPHLRIFLRFSVIFTDKGMGNLAHLRLLESPEYLWSFPLGKENCSYALHSTFPLLVLCLMPPHELVIKTPSRSLVLENAPFNV